jgi:hypothetical protein
LTIDYRCEDPNVDQYLNSYWWVEVSDAGTGAETPDGQSYTHVAVIELGDALMDIFLDQGPDNEVYSGKTFNTKLWAT